MTSDDPAMQSDLLLTRTFRAPRRLVWEAWTHPEHIARWWGPRGFETRVTEMDLRTGGRWRYVMRGPDGKEYPASGTFQEIVPFERIVTTDEFDPDFEKTFGADLPRGIVLTAIFEDLSDDASRTRLTLRIAHATPEDRAKHEKMGVVEGWNSSFGCLDDLLVSLQHTAQHPGNQA